MHPVRPSGSRAGARAARAGFTLIEAMIALAIMGAMLAVGIPTMSDWLLANKAQAAAGLYAEGFALARTQAVSRNSASRLVLTANAGNGQMDWQVDVCFPTASVPCNGNSGTWSTTDAPATRPNGVADDFKSVFRSAGTLPASSVLVPTLSPAGASTVYFTSLGWVDTRIASRLTRIDLAPASGHADAFPASAVVLTLAGIASKCNPNVTAPDSRPNVTAADSRRCPP